MWITLTIMFIIIFLLILILIANDARERLVLKMQIERKQCVVCKHWKQDTCPNSFECFSGDTKKYFEVEE